MAWLISDDDCISLSGYTALDKCPEIVAGCLKVAELIGSLTIHLMCNTEGGDTRIVNDLSRRIDIDPMPNMTRQTWMTGIVMNLLLYGRGNAVVLPHTWKGYLQSLEPIEAGRVSFRAEGTRDYRVIIDGGEYRPENLCHFVYNPDKNALWKGQGVNVALRTVAENLRQAAATEKGFMESKWKPSLIVKVDAMTDAFSGPEGRKKLLEEYASTAAAGEPWLIPAEQFSVEQVKPLSLSDLAIADTVELDKRTVAAVLGVPPFLLGVGEYKKDEWNSFVQTKIMGLCKGIAAELTKKLILSPKWYLRFNVWSLYDYDLKAVSDVLLAGSDRGFVNGDEWRDRVNLAPAGLTEYRVLENYIPGDMSGKQKKLIQGGDDDE